MHSYSRGMWSSNQHNSSSLIGYLERIIRFSPAVTAVIETHLMKYYQVHNEFFRSVLLESQNIYLLGRMM